MKRVIGLMSGTSLDGVDGALVTTDGEAVIAQLASAYRAYSAEERAILQAAVDAALTWGFSGPRPDFTDAEAVLTCAHSDVVGDLLGDVMLLKDEVDLIGFHGQTVIHRAPDHGRKGETLQIGSGAALANATGLPVIYDFRSADMQAGGHGAPLVPLYHQALVQGSALKGPVAIVNIGGVANVTWVPETGDPIAFDTGPGNGLIDAWCLDQSGKPYDEGGELAARGQADLAVLEQLLAHPYFAKHPPKSLDRWDFSLDPVRGMSTENGAATLVEFTAKSIAEALNAVGQTRQVFITGGGRRNPYLMQRLSARLGFEVQPVEARGWDGDLMEAAAFAWLAARVERGLPTSLPSTTGCAAPVCGGRRAEPA
ncbi:anhydro-N-acetylmuramic acid kinase [Maricaulis sp.]|uniref:anhydro-N-acetylmuramic acid kinase n=1 Tax=Maricaulis sp. TaxID=1486257 RepID=UPI00260A0503|nr:anhydro-N-acetylmuramic acid kinase [Maricaulis sp.]